MTNRCNSLRQFRVARNASHISHVARSVGCIGMWQTTTASVVLTVQFHDQSTEISSRIKTDYIRKSDKRKSCEQMKISVDFLSFSLQDFCFTMLYRAYVFYVQFHGFPASRCLPASVGLAAPRKTKKQKTKTCLNVFSPPLLFFNTLKCVVCLFFFPLWRYEDKKRRDIWRWMRCTWD